MGESGPGRSQRNDNQMHLATSMPWAHAFHDWHLVARLSEGRTYDAVAKTILIPTSSAAAMFVVIHMVLGKSELIFSIEMIAPDMVSSRWP